MSLECPNCKIELYTPSERWNEKFLCENCNGTILSEFDFVVLEDEDEWDIYNFKFLGFTNEKLKVLEKVKNNE